MSATVQSCPSPVSSNAMGEVGPVRYELVPQVAGDRRRGAGRITTPHGERPCATPLVRLPRTFSMRYRWSTARHCGSSTVTTARPIATRKHALTAIAAEMLADHRQGHGSDFVDNYKHPAPSVLPPAADLWSTAAPDRGRQCHQLPPHTSARSWTPLSPSSRPRPDLGRPVLS